MLIRVFAFFWLLLCSVAANALTPPALTVEYSADRKIETDSGDMQGRVNAAPGMERNETLMEGMSSAMILRMDKKIGYLLMPAQKMYQELDFSKASKQTGSVTPEQAVLELVGQETVSGQNANKYKFVVKDKSTGGFLWYTSSGIPVKTDVLSKSDGKTERMTVTLENIKIETQDRGLFEVPSDFNKLPSGGLFDAMTGGMGGVVSSNSAVSNASDTGSKRRGGFLGGGLVGGVLGGFKDAVTRPVENEAEAVTSDVAAVKQAPAQSVEQTVTEEVKQVGARATMRETIESVKGLFRKN